MKYVIALLLAWFFAMLNVSALPYLKVLGVTPDFVLIFAACWAVVRGPDEGMIVVPLAGLMRDLTTADPVGTSVLAFAPIVIFAAFRLRALDTDFIPTIAVVAAGSLTFGIIHMMVLGATGQSIDVVQGLLRVVVPGVVVNALFAPVLYLPVRWVTPAVRTRGLQGAGRLTSPLLD